MTSKTESQTQPMTSRFNAHFSRLKAQAKQAFIPFTLLGWPNAETSLHIIKAMIDGGADALELGLAFSDPVADGPVIQKAAFDTLAAGFTVDDAWALIRRVRECHTEIPICIMVYYNMVLARGVEAFYQQAKDAGVDGILVVDLPPEFAAEIVPAATAAGIDPIFIVSPLTSPDRLSNLLKSARGYLYVVSRLGITGTEERYDQDLQKLIAGIHAQSDLPACVGFGISTPAQAKGMFQLGADGVITGSRLIQLVNENPAAPEVPITNFVRSMVAVCG